MGVEISTLCLFSLLCFGRPRISTNNSQCEEYDQLTDKVSLSCHSQSELASYQDRQVHTLFLNGTPLDGQKTIESLQFDHLIIREAKFSELRREPVNNGSFNPPPEHRYPQSLAIFHSSSVAFWSWANFNFKHVHFEGNLLNSADDRSSYKAITSDFLPRSLLTLSMIDCRIFSVGYGSLSFLDSIQMLTITHNHLTTFSRLALPDQPFDLWSIDLSYNKIETLADDFTHNLPTLKELNLRSNQLLTLPDIYFRPPLHLFSLNLADNPLNCDSFCWVFTNLTNEKPKLFDWTECFLPSQERSILAWTNAQKVECGDELINC